MLAMASQRSDGSFAKKDDPLRHALATLGLHMYVDQFKQVGWDDIDFIRTLSAAELEGVARDAEMEPGHAAKFVALISEQQANPASIPGQHIIAPPKASGLDQLTRGGGNQLPPMHILAELHGRGRRSSEPNLRQAPMHTAPSPMQLRRRGAESVRSGISSVKARRHILPRTLTLTLTLTLTRTLTQTRTLTLTLTLILTLNQTRTRTRTRTPNLILIPTPTPAPQPQHPNPTTESQP